MQYGCMERLNRKRGPEVWQFRWSVTGPDGKRLYHKKIVGTVERYLDERAARRSVVGLVLDVAGLFFQCGRRITHCWTGSDCFIARKKRHRKGAQRALSAPSMV